MQDFNAVKYKNDYIKQNYDRVNLTMQKGKKDMIKAAADAADMSLNEFINKAVDEYMRRTGEC